MNRSHASTGGDYRRTGSVRERYIPAERQMELWKAFVDCYSSTSSRALVDRFLRGLFGTKVDPH